MNTLVQAAEGDIVVFTDANVMVDPAALAALRRSFADPTVGCVCGQLVYTNPEAGATAAVGSFYWRLAERITALESRRGSTMGAERSIFPAGRGLHTAGPTAIHDNMTAAGLIPAEGH